MLVTFDTFEYVKELKNSGFSEEQASGLAKAQKKVINEAMDNTLATKDDIHTVVDHILEIKSENELIKNRLAVLEKAVWIVVAGIIALVFKSFIN